MLRNRFIGCLVLIGLIYTCASLEVFASNSGTRPAASPVNDQRFHTAWHGLGSNDPRVAFSAALYLIESGDASIPLMRRQWDARHRVEEIEPKPAPNDEVARLLAQFDSTGEEHDWRMQASDAERGLLRLGDRSRSALVSIRDDRSAEWRVRIRAENVLHLLPFDSGESLRWRRSAEVLAMLKADLAGVLLEEILRSDLNLGEAELRWLRSRHLAVRSDFPETAMLRLWSERAVDLTFARSPLMFEHTYTLPTTFLGDILVTMIRQGDMDRATRIAAVLDWLEWSNAVFLFEILNRDLMMLEEETRRSIMTSSLKHQSENEEARRFKTLLHISIAAANRDWKSSLAHVDRIENIVARSGIVVWLARAAFEQNDREGLEMMREHMMSINARSTMDQRDQLRIPLWSVMVYAGQHARIHEEIQVLLNNNKALQHPNRDDFGVIIRLVQVFVQSGRYLEAITMWREAHRVFLGLPDLRSSEIALSILFHAAGGDNHQRAERIVDEHFGGLPLNLALLQSRARVHGGVDKESDRDRILSFARDHADDSEASEMLRELVVSLARRGEFSRSWEALQLLRGDRVAYLQAAAELANQAHLSNYRGEILTSLRRDALERLSDEETGALRIWDNSELLEWPADAIDLVSLTARLLVALGLHREAEAFLIAQPNELSRLLALQGLVMGKLDMARSQAEK